MSLYFIVWYTFQSAMLQCLELFKLEGKKMFLESSYLSSWCLFFLNGCVVADCSAGMKGLIVIQKQ